MLALDGKMCSGSCQKDSPRLNLRSVHFAISSHYCSAAPSQLTRAPSPSAGKSSLSRLGLSPSSRLSSGSARRRSNAEAEAFALGTRSSETKWSQPARVPNRCTASSALTRTPPSTQSTRGPEKPRCCSPCGLSQDVRNPEVDPGVGRHPTDRAGVSSVLQRLRCQAAAGALHLSLGAILATARPCMASSRQHSFSPSACCRRSRCPWK